MGEETTTGVNYKKLAETDYNTAQQILTSALHIVRAYLIQLPPQTQDSDLNQAIIIARLGKNIGAAASGLEQRVHALEEAGVLRDSTKDEYTTL